MARRQTDPLRALDAAERAVLSRLSRSRGAPAARVARARALLAVAEGQRHTTAARLAGRRTGDTVARWVAGFNRDGLAALVPGHGGGHPVSYGADEQRRILAEVARPPDRARDGTATRSLTTLRDALRRAEGGLPGISTYTIGRTLHAAGLSWQKSRTWCEPHLVRDRRGRARAQARGPRHRHRSGRRRQKGLIERAYTLGAALGLAVWCEDEAGPFRAVPQPGGGRRPRGHPATRPHEYVRGGTCEILTLFHPATGQVHLRPAAGCAPTRCCTAGSRRG